MTELEDAVAREHSAEVMHLRLCEAFDRGEPVGGVSGPLRYPVRVGTHVKCVHHGHPAGSTWARFDGRTGEVIANSNGETAVTIDGSGGLTFWFRVDELRRKT